MAIEKFEISENVIPKLEELMELTQNEEDFYSWYNGCDDLEEMKRLFEIYYRQSISSYYGGTYMTQEEFIEMILERAYDEHDEKAKSVKEKSAQKEEPKDIVTGPIYDDDNNPTYMVW